MHVFCRALSDIYQRYRDKLRRQLAAGPMPPPPQPSSPSASRVPSPLDVMRSFLTQAEELGVLLKAVNERGHRACNIDRHGLNEWIQ